MNAAWAAGRSDAAPAMRPGDAAPAMRPRRCGPAMRPRRSSVGDYGSRLHKPIGMCLYVLMPGTDQMKAFQAASELLKVLSAPPRLAIVMEFAEQPSVVDDLMHAL